MRFDLVTLFPEMFEAIRCGIPGRAIDKGIASINCWNPRDYTQDVHRTVDDRPYGGGPSKVIYLSPQGRRFDQEAALQMSKREGVILLAGRYEGIDERLLELDVDEEWSIGDYVLSGGELPAMVMMDAIIRLLPDALGHAQSAQQDSHVGGLLDCPHFTRPEEIDGLAVPQVLLSGDHEKIRQWRLQQA
ncbi:tRNA (guanosine(37)-N1)-methyltransferase TrmD, partial [Solemya velum gill symbiont]